MTLSSIRELLRDLIDQPSDGIWKNPKLNRLIFSQYREITSAITRRWADYYTTSGSISTTASSAYTDLPSTCTILKKIVDSDGNTKKWLHNSQFAHGDTSSEPSYFDVIGRKIWWSPTPDAVYTYTAYYHYQPTDLALDSSIPELPPNFHDILAYGVAVKTKLAKEDDIRSYQAIYNQKMDDLLHQISIPQTNNARRVLRTYDASEL